MKIIIDNKIPFIQGALEPFAEVVYLPGAEISGDDVRDADAMIVRTRTKCNAELLAGSDVKFIATATIGFDHIDSDYCESRNISWTSAPGCNSFSVQQYIASTLLNIAGDEGFQLKDKTIGIVGVGNVGSKVAKFAETVGMNVLLNDPPLQDQQAGSRSKSPASPDLRKEKSTSSMPSMSSPEARPHAPSSMPDFVSLDEIREQADIITFHVPLEKDGKYPTYHMVDKEFICSIASTGRKVWIFNSSRGPVVDNATLKMALGNECLAGAVLDVWENEPNIELDLLKLAKFATPHIAGYSADGKANGTSMSVQAVSRFFGLGIDDWKPENLPSPDNCKLSIDCEGKTLQDVMRTAILAGYDIKGDDNALRQSPGTFEKQRGNYPLRREPPAYKINLLNDWANFTEKLKQLRFN